MSSSRVKLTVMEKHWLIVGCGYVGSRVAGSDLALAEIVSLPSHDRTSAQMNAEHRHHRRSLPMSLIPIHCRALPDADVWLHAVAFDRASPLPRRAVTVDGLRNVLDVAARKARKFIHLSTASVYGTSDGSWVDELTPCEPMTEAGQLALEAERLVSDFNMRVASHQSTATILRLAGIYGPGRLIARVDQLRERALIPGTGDSWLNLIHVDDIVQIAERVAWVERPDELYLVADDQPLARREFYSEVARLKNTPLPCFECDSDVGSSEFSTQPVSNGRTQGLNKRCRNTKIREGLQVELLHPSIHSGLPASL